MSKFKGETMIRSLVALLLFLTTNETLADVKNKEKAKFDLISSIEILVNIDECRKGVHDNSLPETMLPRACNSLPHLGKYFFTKKDKEAIEDYLNSEESKVTSSALRLVETHKFKKLGKMTLSSKCVKNRDPVDLDIYLNKIRGLPYIPEDVAPDTGTKAVNTVDPRNPAHDFDKEFEGM